MPTFGRICVALTVMAGLGCGASALRMDPHTVSLRTDVANRFVPADEPSEMLARVRIHAEAAHPTRPHINLALVIDTSGSMEGEAIENARAASRSLVQMLEPGDRLALVVFHSRTEVLMPSTEIDDEAKNKFEQKISEIVARGTTDLAGGLDAGVAEVLRHFDAEGVNRVVLLGDGVPNDATVVPAMAQAAGARHIAITALGLGLDYDESLMGAIAQLSGGHFHFVEQSSEVASVFRDEVLRFQRVVARNAVATLTPGPGIAIRGVIGQRTTPTATGVQLDLGDLSDGTDRDLIVRCSVPARSDGAAIELMDVSVGFDDAVQHAGHFEHKAYLGLHATSDEQTLESANNANIVEQAREMEAAAVKIRAIEMARRGELERAREELNESAAQYRAAPGYQDDEALQRSVSSMADLGEALPAAVPPPRSVSTASAPDAPSPPPISPEAQERLRSIHAEAVNQLGY